MLQIKTYVAQSKIKGAGVGLFANQNIKKGCLVWKFEEPDIMFDRTQLLYVESINPLMKEFIKKYGYIEEINGTLDGKDYVQRLVILCFDNARFTNHSNKPNLDDGVDFRTYAGRDIKHGEELTSDYKYLKSVK